MAHCWGWRIWGECRAESEIGCQAAAQEYPNIIDMEEFNEQASQKSYPSNPCKKTMT